VVLEKEKFAGQKIFQTDSRRNSMMNKKILPLLIASIAGCTEAEQSASQTPASQAIEASTLEAEDSSVRELEFLSTTGDISDSYYVEAEIDTVEIVPSQYDANNQKLAPPSVCGQNGINLDLEMEKFEIENANWRLKSDPKLRIVQNGIGSFAGLESGSDIFTLKNEAVNKAILNAKANIIKTINTTITAEQIAFTPIYGMSIDEKIDRQAQDLRNRFNTLLAETQILGEEYTQLTNAVMTSSNDENLMGLTTEDRAASFFDAVIKKLDESYDPATATEEKKQKIESLKRSLNDKRIEFFNSSNQLVDLQKDLDLAKERAKSQTTVETLSQMPLYGASMVKHIECYDAEERSMYVMVKMIWTPKLHEEARAVLLNEEIELEKGDESFEDHIYGLDLTQLLGSYRYIDDQGTPWFYSIRSADATKGNSGAIQDFTNTLASGQVALALQAEVYTHAIANASVSSAEQSRSSVTAEQFQQEQTQIVKDLKLNINIARSSVVTSPITNAPSRVSIAAVNLKAAHDAPQVMADLYATLKEVNSEMSYRQGLIQGMRDEAETTRNDPTALAEGYAEGRESVDQVVEQRTSTQAQANTLLEEPSTDVPAQSENSSSFSSQAVKDDF